MLGTPYPGKTVTAAEPSAGATPNHFSCIFAIVPSSFMHSTAISSDLRNSAESLRVGGRRSCNEVVSTSLHRWEQSGILGSINGYVALQTPGKFVGEVDVETLIAATGKIWKGMRRERAIDSGM